jgi:hypothetical protein
MKILIDNGHGIQTKGKRSPDGTRWHTATGWSCYTCKGQTQSDTLANCLYQAAIKNFPGKSIKTDYSDNDPDWESPHIKNLNIA